MVSIQIHVCGMICGRFGENKGLNFLNSPCKKWVVVRITLFMGWSWLLILKHAISKLLVGLSKNVVVGKVAFST